MRNYTTVLWEGQVGIMLLRMAQNHSEWIRPPGEASGLSWVGAGSTHSIWHKQRSCCNMKSAVPEFAVASSVRSGHQRGYSEVVWLIKLLHLKLFHLFLASPKMSRKFDCAPPVSSPSSADCRWQKVQLAGRGWHHLAIKSESPRSA